MPMYPNSIAPGSSGMFSFDTGFLPPRLGGGSAYDDTYVLVVDFTNLTNPPLSFFGDENLYFASTVNLANNGTVLLSGGDFETGDYHPIVADSTLNVGEIEALFGSGERFFLDTENTRVRSLFSDPNYGYTIRMRFATGSVDTRQTIFAASTTMNDGFSFTFGLTALGKFQVNRQSASGTDSRVSTADLAADTWYDALIEIAGGLVTVELRTISTNTTVVFIDGLSIVANSGTAPLNNTVFSVGADLRLFEVDETIVGPFTGRIASLEIQEFPTP